MCRYIVVSVFPDRLTVFFQSQCCPAEVKGAFGKVSFLLQCQVSPDVNLLSLLFSRDSLLLTTGCCTWAILA